MYYFVSSSIVLFFAIMMGILTNGYGVVTLPGFAHGAGMCGTDRYVAIDEKSIIQYEKGNTFIITKTRIKDKRVRQLKKLTHEICKE